MNKNTTASLTAALLSSSALAYAARRSAGSTHAAALRVTVDSIKTSAGCESCGYNDHACALQFDHIDPATKYRTKFGNLVHPADMVKGGRYGTRTVLAEIAKCRVLCANCHSVHTHTEQRTR